MVPYPYGLCRFILESYVLDSDLNGLKLFQCTLPHLKSQSSTFCSVWNSQHYCHWQWYMFCYFEFEDFLAVSTGNPSHTFHPALAVSQTELLYEMITHNIATYYRIGEVHEKVQQLKLSLYPYTIKLVYWHYNY